MEKFYFVFFVIAGALLNLIFGWNEAAAKPDYRFLIFIKQNIVPFILNILCGILLVLATKETGYLNAVFYGTAGQYWFKKLQNVFNPDYPTLVGPK
jgi:hypothetical protein